MGNKRLTAVIIQRHVLAKEKEVTASETEKKINQNTYHKFLLTSFAGLYRNVFFAFFRKDLAPSSIGLYGNLSQILSHSGLAVG